MSPSFERPTASTPETVPVHGASARWPLRPALRIALAALGASVLTLSTARSPARTEDSPPDAIVQPLPDPPRRAPAGGAEAVEQAREIVRTATASAGSTVSERREERADLLAPLPFGPAVHEIVRRIDDGRCERRDLREIESIRRSSADAGDRILGALAFVQAELLRCLGDRAGATPLYAEAGSLDPRLAPVAARRARPAGRDPEAPDASTDPTRGGWDSLRRILAVARDGAFTPEQAVAMLDALAGARPSCWLRDDLEAVRWALALAAHDPDRALRARIEWLRDSPEASAWNRLFREALDLVPALDLEHASALVPVAFDRMDRLARDGDANGAEALLTDLVSAGLVPGEERGDWSEWIDALEGLDGSHAERGERTLRGLAERAGAIGEEARWSLVRTYRRADRDGEALELVRELLYTAGSARRPQVLRACIELAGWTGDVMTQSACWERFAQESEEDADVAALAVEVAVDAMAQGMPGQAILVIERALGGMRDGESSSDGLLARLHYWRGRTLDSLGESEDAAREYRDAFRLAPLSYEGIASDSRLVERGEPPKFPALVRALRTGSPGFAREPQGLAGFELASLGFVQLAQQETLYQAELWGGSAPETLSLAAELLAARGERRRAEWVAGQLGDPETWDPDALARRPGRVWQLAFPSVFWKLVSSAALLSETEASLIFAVIRRESGFDSSAISSVGAQGLMQVMPETARTLSSRNGGSGAPGRRALRDPETNLRFGTSMLSYLDAAFGGRIELMMAGYCSGPFRSARWFARTPEGDADLWLERVPYPVVREYVREVVVASHVYAAWLGESPPEVALPLPERVSP